MKLINFSGLIFIAMWLTVSHFKGYKVGCTVKKIFSMKTKERSEKITVCTKIDKNILKYLRKNGEKFKIACYGTEKNHP